MKRFLLRLIIFFALLFVIDRVVGGVINYFTTHSIGGYVAHHNYINDKMNQEVLIFGSSRAVHHYNSQIIEDSLDMSCYNCGQDGNGIILNYGQWQMISKRYNPKYIIYDVSESFDLFLGEPNTKYLGWLKPYYGREGIKEIFESVDKIEKYKMLSNMYKSNSKFLQISADYLHPIYKLDSHGFLPLNGDIDTMKIQKQNSSEKDLEIPEVDSLKIYYLEEFIKSRDQTGLIFTISPTWYDIDVRKHLPIKNLCKKYHIPFYDFSNDKKYVHNNEYFKDGTHLNAHGADEFTKDLIHILKKDSVITSL